MIKDLRFVSGILQYQDELGFWANVPSDKPPVAKSPGDLGWGFDNFGTPCTSAADAERVKNLNQWQATYDAEVLKGPVPISALTNEDKGFLLYCEENYRMQYTQLFYAVCSGPKAEIDRAILWADTHRGEFNYDRYDRSKLGGYVDAFSKGLLAPKY